MADTSERSCVRCGQVLPGKSKLTVTTISAEQCKALGIANERQEPKVTVDMCLQCQIDLSNAARPGIG